MQEIAASRSQRWQRVWEKWVAAIALWALYSKFERANLRSIVLQIEGDLRLSHLNMNSRRYGNDERRNEAIHRGMTASISHHRSALGTELAHHELFAPKYRKHEQQIAGEVNQHRGVIA